MKFKQDCDGTWVLMHRPYITLCFTIAIFSITPYSIITDRPDKIDACIISLLFSSLCFWGFSDFSTLKISAENIFYTRNWFFYKRKIEWKRSDLISVDLDISTQRNSGCKRIKFSFADGTSITMPKAFVGSTIGWTVNEMYQSIMAVLPELKQDSSDEILSLISKGHKIQAINLIRRQYGMGLAEAKKFADELKLK